jgi:hypothetical protein
VRVLLTHRTDLSEHFQPDEMARQAATSGQTSFLYSPDIIPQPASTILMVPGDHFPPHPPSVARAGREYPLDE